MAITVAHCGSQLQADSEQEGAYGRSVRARWPCPARAPGLPVPVAGTLPGGPWVPRVSPGTQVPNGSQRTVNGPLTDPLTANGRIRPLTVNGVAELRIIGNHWRIAIAITRT